MGRYATTTEVPVERSKAEIEGLLVKYGATEFQSGWRQGEAMVGFRIKDLAIRFVLPFPDRAEERLTHKKVRGFLKPLTDAQRERAYEQEVRSRWRALNLVVKAKLEAVEVGISTIEHEFLAFVVLPDNTTLGQWITDQAIKNIREGRMPLALPPHDYEPIEGEVIP